MKRSIAMSGVLFITVVLVVSTLMSTMIAAASGADAERTRWERQNTSHEAPSGSDRLVMYHTWDQGATVLSMGRGGDRYNVFYFTLDLEDGVYLHYNFFRSAYSEEAEDFHRLVARNRRFPENGQPSGPPRAPTGNDPPSPAGGFPDIGFSISMSHLREFNDTVPRISVYDLRTAVFTPPTIRNRERDGVSTGLVIRTATRDGILGLTFYLTSTEGQGDEDRQTPFEVKYDISIMDYPFKARDSFLALENAFGLPDTVVMEQSERRIGQRPLPPDRPPRPAERTIGYDMDSLFMFFSWAGNVTVDGEDHNVTAHYTVSVEGESDMVERMTFIYPRGRSILHDPIMGVAELQLSVGEAADFAELLLSWSAGIGLGAVVMIAVAARLKPSRFDWED